MVPVHERLKDPTQPIQVLLVEDNTDDAFLTQQLLKAVPDRPYVTTWVDTFEKGWDGITSQQYDVFLIDYRLQGGGGQGLTGLDLLQKAMDHQFWLPVIMLTGLEDPEVDLKAMAIGAADYLVKDELTYQMLDRSIRYAIAHHTMVQNIREREQEKQLLLATLTHDLRTPIKAEHRILDELLGQRFGAVTPEQAQVLKEMIKSNRYLNYMVESLLGVFKFEQGSELLVLEPTDINDLLVQVAQGDLRVLMEDKQLTVKFHLTPDLSPIALDVLEMKRVLYNLLQNAINFSPQGGTIYLTTEPFLEPDHRSGILFSISDEGPGVALDRQPYLFNPFSSLAKKYREVGIGLGLYLCKQIVEAHHGTIRYAPSPGVIGARFEVKLYCELPYNP